MSALSIEQIEREIEALRKQAEAHPPSGGLLHSVAYQNAMRRVWALESELARRSHIKTRGSKRHAKRLRYSWCRNFISPNSPVARRLEREAKKRLSLALELPEPPRTGGLAERLGIL